jgi:peptidoglycan hydrolase CwlO-like protein
MTDMLEKKVSSLLAQIDRLESEAEDEFKKKVNFNSEIEELQKVIKSLDN